MASHDTTSKDFIFDVFLSFRDRTRNETGEGDKTQDGTRYGFAGHLYHALLHKGIKTFRVDEELRIGDQITPTILHTIENSRISVVLLCPYYASSTWCLDELAKIMDCYHNKKQHVFPIFYKVEPADVRHQRNSYEAPMIKHEHTYGKDSHKVKAWKSALFAVSNLSGVDCKGNKYESELIKKIIKNACAKIPPLPLEMERVVGLDSRLEQVKSSLIEIEAKDSVCMFGIYGARGIGKTTFAKYLYNRICHQFEAASFLANIREKTSNNSIIGLKKLQKTLLYELGEETETEVTTSEIKRKLAGKRVLLVLDDIDTLKQLKSLAGGDDWFGSGSKIIITTRDKIVLDKYDVEIKKYKMEELNNHDSLKLFCWNAFNKNEPAEKFVGISSRAVSFAKGIPLNLKVTGFNLKGLSVEECETELDKFEKVPSAFLYLVDSFQFEKGIGEPSNL